MIDLVDVSKGLNPGMTDAEVEKILKLYRAHYFHVTTPAIYKASKTDLYFYETYIGHQMIETQEGDSVWWIARDEDNWYAKVTRGRERLAVESEFCATVIRGYTPDERSVRVGMGTVLPYVNGCSTKQLVHPARLGDPTLQMLNIPPYSREQAHHIHSTVRVVYVAEGRGISSVGMEGKVVNTELKPGTVCILDPMSPHHFETPFGEPLVVFPLHVYSSTTLEKDHPMFNGTHLMNQGAE